MQCLNHPDADQDIVRCLRCRQPFCPDCVVMLRGYWYCGPCKDEQVRDIQSGTSSAMELASVGRRIAALIIDSLVQGMAMMLVLIPFFLLVGGMAAATGGDGNEPSDAAAAVLGVGIMGFYAIVLLLSIAIPLVYEGWMVQRRGQTLGKMALDIRVVGPDGGPVSRGQAWGRAAMKTMLTQACSCFGLLADDLPAAFTDQKTALHDMAASTRVVRVR